MDTDNHKTIPSKDGTSIGYHQLGQGPGLILVQGTMGTAHNFKELSEMLADSFTVYVPDRRGRGMSDAGPDDYSMQKEVEDLNVLLTETGAHYVFGLSSGAIISLTAALTLPAIQKLAIYEPPLFTAESLPKDKIARYNSEISEGKVIPALITGMLAGEFGPSFLNKVPRRLLEGLVGMAVKSEKKKGAGGYMTMEALAPTLRNDFSLVSAAAGRTDDFANVKIPVLMLEGSKSPAYLHEAMNALDKVLPNATRKELPGADHGTAWNKDRRGDPIRVATELKTFFSV